MISSIRKQASWPNRLTIMTSSWAPCVVGSTIQRISAKYILTYIMMVGCLYSYYRRLGIGTLMVEHVLNYVEQDGDFDAIFL